MKLLNKLSMILLAMAVFGAQDASEVAVGVPQYGAGVGLRAVGADSAGITCDVCAESKARREFDTLSCGHNCCNGCLDYMVHLAIRAKSTQALKCPDSECSSALSEQDIRVITNNDPVKLGAYADITAQEWLTKQSAAKFCPTLGCQYAFLNERGRRCEVTCASCRKKYCSKCLREHDVELSCIEAIRDDSHTTKYIKWKRANTKPCPTCTSSIQKDGGCKYMTCGKCGTHFCWRCLKKVDGHGEHECSKISTGQAHRIIDAKLPKIINAAILDDVKLFNEAIAETASLNIRDYRSNTPLILACSNMSLEVAYRLLEKVDIDVNAQNYDKDTALIIACRNGHLGLVEAIVERGGVDLNIKNSFYKSALAEAVRFNRFAIVKFLMSQPGIDVNAWGSILIHAINGKRINIIQALLQDPNIKVENYHFFAAAKTDNVHILKLVLGHIESYINCQSCFGETALSIACGNCNIEMVRLLLSIPGIDVNLGKSLSAAIKAKRIDIIKILLQQPSIVVTRSDFVASAAINDVDILNLIDGRVVLPINCKNLASKSALHIACIDGNAEVVKWLLGKDDININITGINGETPLMHACYCGHIDIVKLLLARDDIDINAKDGFGQTVLMHVCFLGYFDIVKLLLARAEVQVNARTNDGHSALNFICVHGNMDIIKLFLEKGGSKINTWAAIAVALFNGHFAVTSKLLLKKSKKLVPNCMLESAALDAQSEYRELNR